MNAMIEEWRNIADYHEHQLALARKKLEEIDPSFQKKKYVDLETELLELATTKNITKKDRKLLQKHINDGLIDNINNLLLECRNVWALDYKKKIPDIEWNNFVMKVLEKLFSSLYDDHLGAFDDTAGGCDEVVWEAGCEVLGVTY